MNKIANEKRLIAENDIYALFGENGMARLHVADIDVLPRVDAVEVVHGEWTIIEDDWNDEVIYECSVCKEAFVTLDGEPMGKLYNYCPNCGAKMDGDGNEGV